MLQIARYAHIGTNIEPICAEALSLQLILVNNEVFPRLPMGATIVTFLADDPYHDWLCVGNDPYISAQVYSL
jgi:hypothetical protein